MTMYTYIQPIVIILRARVPTIGNFHTSTRKHIEAHGEWNTLWNTLSLSLSDCTLHYSISGSIKCKCLHEVVNRTSTAAADVTECVMIRRIFE